MESMNTEMLIALCHSRPCSRGYALEKGKNKGGKGIRVDKNEDDII